MKPDTENTNPDRYSTTKPRKPKSREGSSRFLSPPATGAAVQVQEELPTLKSRTSASTVSAATDARKQNKKEAQEEGEPVMTRRIWPSTSSTKLSSLAEQIGKDRIDDIIIRRKAEQIGKDCIDDIIIRRNDEVAEKFGSLSRQRSCRELGRFENDNNQGTMISWENHNQHKGGFSGSMRYTGKLLLFSKKSSNKTSSYDDSPSSVDDIAPGRMSINETALGRRSLVGNSEPDLSRSKLNSPPVRSKKSGVEGPSRSMSFDTSEKKKSPRLKRTSSMTTLFGSTMSKWAMSPGRSGSPPMTVENKGVPPMSFSSMKPPTSPSKGKHTKGVGTFLSKGLDLIRGKDKKRVPFSSPSPLGLVMIDSVHQLRINYNRLVQWRYANAQATDVNKTIVNQAESDLMAAWDSVTKLQHSVVEKRIQLEKEKLQMKLCHVLRSHIESLKAWGEIERQHTSAVSMTKDCLQSVICKVPLVEGAKMDPHPTSIALPHASDLTTSIKSMLFTNAPEVENTSRICSELAEVAAQEKALLQEFSELFNFVSILEAEERSLKCCLIQMKAHQQEEDIGS